MENKANMASCWEQFEEQETDEDTISLSNFAMQEDQSNERDHRSSSSSSSPHHFFEFFNEFSSPECYYRSPNIIFCGKLIIDDRSQEEELNEYQKRDYLTPHHSSLSSPPPSYYYENNDDQLPRQQQKSGTPPPKPSPVRLSNSNSNSTMSSHSSTALYHRRDQKVNITALTSMSVQSRRRMFMFGPVKFKPEMELSAIKERQGKRLNTMIMAPPPTAVFGREVKRRSHWGMVRHLRGRARLTDVLSKSFGFGCSRGNSIKVAN